MRTVPIWPCSAFHGRHYDKANCKADFMAWLTPRCVNLCIYDKGTIIQRHYRKDGDLSDVTKSRVEPNSRLSHQSFHVNMRITKFLSLIKISFLIGLWKKISQKHFKSPGGQKIHDIKNQLSEPVFFIDLIDKSEKFHRKLISRPWLLLRWLLNSATQFLLNDWIMQIIADRNLRRRDRAVMQPVTREVIKIESSWFAIFSLLDDAGTSKLVFAHLNTACPHCLLVTSSPLSSIRSEDYFAMRGIGCRYFSRQNFESHGDVWNFNSWFGRLLVHSQMFIKHLNNLWHSGVFNSEKVMFNKLNELKNNAMRCGWGEARGKEKETENQ